MPLGNRLEILLLSSYRNCFRFELNDKTFIFFIMCLFVRVVDHGVNEGEPVDEQYCEQVNEDQFRDPEPEGQYFDQTSRKAWKTASSIPSFDACFCPSFYKHNLLACFTKIAYVLPTENTVG